MGFIYRMPVGFGPSWGPRQGPGGKRFENSVSRTTFLTSSFLTNPDQMAKLLPPGIVPAADPVVTIRGLYNRDFAWLAGRAYNYVEVLFRAVFRGEQDEVEGDYVAVMWEGMADACIVGRDEAGHPKIYAEVPDPETRGGNTYGEMSWYGFRFFEHEYAGLVLGPWPYEREATTPFAPKEQTTMVRPRLHYKYFANAENMEVADVAYTVMTPAGSYEQRILDRWNGPASVRFLRSRWEDLPTFGYMSNAMADLELVQDLGGSMVRVLRGFNDLRDSLKILR
jgi:hypothetical protein